jgi:transcription-repair coupling factor (superfamily II helicase)
VELRLRADENVEIAEVAAPPAAPEEPIIRRPPAALVAARLIAAAPNAEKPLVYVALSESSASKIAEAVPCLDPDLPFVFLPPWDCLPYDRVPPSRQCMGRRMDALRVWNRPASQPSLMITSLDALLQRVPPSSVIDSSRYRLAVGETFDRQAFEDFVLRSGYMEDAVVDEAGELAFRDDVIDIFPAGASMPMRIVLAEDGKVSELRSYDPVSQRTVSTLEEKEFGPASEAIAAEAETGEEPGRGSGAMERRLYQLYGEMQTIFDLVGTARMTFAAGAGERAASYLEIIEEARHAHHVGDQTRTERHSLYLEPREWNEAFAAAPVFDLDLDESWEELPSFTGSTNSRKAFSDYVKSRLASHDRVAVLGNGAAFESLCRRLEREQSAKMLTAARWADMAEAEPGTLLKLACDLEHGFADSKAKLAVITTADVVGGTSAASSPSMLLSEPELAVGDVVVHEDHGVAVLAGLENVAVDGVTHDAARLEYRDGASILVPMQEFGKLWRYGSQPEAVTLDRLHTEQWAKKRAAVDKDIRLAARHLLRLARERQEAQAEIIVPPRAQYQKFVARFPYLETADQAAAIEAVLADLGSGTFMNRLICGDVGFGKTEVALRAAAAVALSGRQVAVIAPTTVLARQHFTTFQRRFAATGIEVAMLSRVVAPADAKRVKAGLASGEIGVVIATQAILAKDVAFDRLALSIIDEEHRFGARDKAAMGKMAQLLHRLIMSATPIPRTLQAAMVGIQDVSLLTTAPAKRRPVRTSLDAFDKASVRVALLRERRRGGQSFFVAPQIEDLEGLKATLAELVPELTLRVAHGKMPAAEMDEVMVSFSDGEGDILLSTNIVESGLDVPRANTIFVWRADRFGVAQLHQLRGRVGRGKAQGIAYLLTDTKELSEETRLRLTTLVQNDRLGAGLAISMEDLDLRGGGDIVGEDQAGHMKVLGISLYQKLLERAVAVARKKTVETAAAPTVNVGISGLIPVEYVSDATVRLNLYARLLRANSAAEIDGFEEELDDRFGELPPEASILLRLAKLRIVASRLRIGRLEAGPRAMAIAFAGKPSPKLLKALSARTKPVWQNDKLIYEQPTEDPVRRIKFFEHVLQINS